jgi:hypothetical protein
MHFGRGETPQHGIEQIRSGVKEFEDCLEDKEQKLSELFVSLKDDILSSDTLNLDHVRILQKQVRHILSIARAISYPELEHAFEQEEDVLGHIGDLLEHYPSMDISGSADLQAALKNLRSMISYQQDMIFRHKEIMSHEKQRLIQILQEASELEEEFKQEQTISASSHKTILH